MMFIFIINNTPLWFCVVYFKQRFGLKEVWCFLLPRFYIKYIFWCEFTIDNSFV